MVFSIFLELCNHPYNQFENGFITSRGNPGPLSYQLHSPQPAQPASGSRWSAPVSLGLSVLDMSYECNCSVCGL